MMFIFNGINIFALLSVYFHYAHCELVVNVRAPDQEVLREVFKTNTTDDSITLDFNLQRGVYVTQVVDFKQNLQIFRVITLGEEELFQPPYQVHCFVKKFDKNDFITSDAMFKLRQKNPSTIRTPEGDYGTEETVMTLTLDVAASGFISPHIPTLCDEAPSSTFASEQDLKFWISQKQDLDVDWPNVVDISRHLSVKSLQNCSQAIEGNSPCSCGRKVCLYWYPCGLKYCSWKDSSGKSVSYRCGIKTCRKCHQFFHFASQKMDCLMPENS